MTDTTEVAQALPQNPILDGSIDYTMDPAAEDSRLWISVGVFSVNIKHTPEGVIIDLYAKGAESEPSLSSAFAENGDAEETLRESGNGWAVFSPAEAALHDGAGWWHNAQGWVQEEECSVFTEYDKSTLNLPISSGLDATWVSLKPSA